MAKITSIYESLLSDNYVPVLCYVDDRCLTLVISQNSTELRIIHQVRGSNYFLAEMVREDRS